MMDLALVNGRVMTDLGPMEGLAVGLRDGRIRFVGPEADLPQAMVRHDLEGADLLPGFIDTQVNGGGGVLFNDQPTTDGIAAIGAAHRRFGTTGFLPTLITDHLEVVDAGMKAAAAGMSARLPGLLGIHLEGPFLNPARRGVHDAARLQQLDPKLLPLLTGMIDGRTMITLAPETVSTAMLQALSARGVRVCAGHTDATYEATKEALANGVTGFTHLFNAMSPLGSRAPGVVGAALESESAWCGIIVDGRHVSPVTLKLALKCHPHSRFMLVTDAMPCVGASGADFWLQGRRISVSDGVCMDEAGTLAGSALDMASAVRNAMTMLGLDLTTASRMASLNPASFLGLDHDLGRIAPGYRANLVAVDRDLRVLHTWIEGQGQTHSPDLNQGA